MSCPYCTPVERRRRHLISLERLGPRCDGHLRVWIARDDDAELLAVDVSEGGVSRSARRRISSCPVCARDLGGEG